MAEQDLAKKNGAKRALSRLALSTALGGLAVLGYGRGAYAQCIGGSSPYLCAGSTTTTESLSGEPLIVTVQPGFDIDTTSSGGDAFDLESEGGTGFYMGGNGASQVEADAFGIDSENEGGRVTITTTGGSVYGYDGGIRVDSSRIPTSLKYAPFSYVSGDTTITTADVAGRDGDAINVDHTAFGKYSSNVAIDTTEGAVSGGGDGIDVYRGGGTFLFIFDHGGIAINGDANLEITTGDIDVDGVGVRAYSQAISILGDATTDIDTTAGTITSGESGILVENRAFALNGDTSVTVTTADVNAGYGGETAIDARNYGISGSASVIEDYASVTPGDSNLTIDTTEGTVYSAQGDGIFGLNDSFSLAGDTNLTITTYDVSAYGNGVTAVNLSTSGLGLPGLYGDGDSNLTIDTSAGSVNSGYTGVYAYNLGTSEAGTSNLTVTTADVTSEDGDGVVAFNGRYIDYAPYTTYSPSGYLGSNLTIDTSAGSVTADYGTYGVAGANYGYAIDGDSSLSITTADVSSGYLGVGGRNVGLAQNGSSDLTIDTTMGTVYGTNTGIGADNYGSGGGGTSNLTIRTADVSTRDTDAIFALNEGYGANGSSLSIDTTMGRVLSEYGSGINARNASYSKYGDANLSVTTYDVAAEETAITATNTGRSGYYVYGYGPYRDGGNSNLTVNTVAGTVSSTAGSGIVARNAGVAYDGTSNLQIVTSSVDGELDGINAVIGDYDGNTQYAYAGSNLSIDTTAGTITSRYGTGIYARNDGSAYNGDTNVTITTGSVTQGGFGLDQANGYGDAITAINSSSSTNGDANLSVSVMGNAWTTSRVYSKYGNGIYALNESTSGEAADVDITIDQYSSVYSEYGAGIIAINSATPGSGYSSDITIQNDGHVESFQSDGIVARNTTAEGGVSINSYDVRAGGDGIYGSVAGSGGIDITVTGYAVGRGGSGISSTNTGTGATDIDVAQDAYVLGATQAIYASHSSGAAFTIDNAGYLGNRSYDSAALSINAESSDAGVVLTNTSTGRIVGTVDLTDQDDTFDNAGRWDTSGGTSDFGGGADVLNNTSSNTIIVGNGSAGQMTVFNDLETFNNSGRIDFADGFASDTLTTSSGFNASGASELEMDIFAGGDGAPADLFVINGNVTGTPTTIEIFQAGGIGDITGFGQDDGIAVVDVSNTGGTDPADFVLLEPFEVLGVSYAFQTNVYLYNDLVLGTDNIWRIQSQFLPTIPEYEAYPLALLSMSDIGTYRERRGDRSVAMMDATGSSELWLQIGGTQLERGEEGSISETTVDQDFYSVTAGLDMTMQGGLTAGVNLGFSNGSTHVASPHGNGMIETDGWSLGASLTYEDQSGFYVDAQGRLTWFDSDLMGVTGNSGQSFAISVEVGQEIALQDGWTVVPQAQLSYTSVDFDSFTGPFGETVTLEDGDSLIARLGVSVDREWAGSNGSQNSVYGLLNLTHELADGTRVDVGAQGYDPISFTRTPDETRAEVGLGGSFGLGNGSYFYGDISVSQGLSNTDSREVSGRIGLNFTW